MLHSIEHWRAVVEPDTDPETWALLALAFIGRLASFPKELEIKDEVATSARVIFARTPKELLVLGAQYEEYMRQLMKQHEKNLDAIDQELEDFDFDKD